MFGIREAYGLLTLLALLGAGWLLFDLLRAEPGEDRLAVVLLFGSADGVHEGTPVKTRGVSVGEVRRVSLAPGGRGAEVLCSLSSAPGAAPRAGSRFWIVRPWFGGIAAGGGGLDTLIKDSYVAYDQGDPAAPMLTPGSRVPGMRLPPDNPRALLDLPSAPGDLEIAVRFATSGGLVAAAPVRHRGIPVGIVSSVELLPEGGGVEVRARIERSHRSLVHAESMFWIDGVDIRAGWRGVSVEGLEAILSGSALAFHTENERSRTPAADGAVFVGRTGRPEIDWRAPDPPAPSQGTSARLTGDDPGLAALVSVHYSCIEEDWFSKDDHYERTSPGVLHRTPDGLPAVLVLARGVDGRLWIEDSGDPEITEESITVVHRDGSVQVAGVAWRAEEEIDLALLRLPAVPPGAGPARVRALPLTERSGPIDLYSLGDDGEWRRLSGSLGSDGTLVGIPAETRSGVLLRDGTAIGLWRGPGYDVPTRAVLFDALPASLREVAPPGPAVGAAGG